MKLCIDARMLSCSGIGTYLKNLIPYFSPQETTLIVRPEDVALYPWLKAYSLALSQAPIYSIREQIEIPRLVPECDLFWSPHYNVPLLPLRAKKRMVTIHDAAHLAFKTTLGWKERCYANLMFRQAVSRSHLIVTDSLFSQAELSHYLSIPKEKIRVIPIGVDVGRFVASSSLEKQEELRKRFQLPERFLLFVGNLKPHKNLKVILDAYERFGICIPTVAIGKMRHLLHPDPLIHTIEASAGLREKILLIGEVLDEEIPYFYKMAEALLFPSLYEGFGLPPLEAMASGCPVIASNRASLPEVCGGGAYFIDPSEPQELFRAINDLTSNTGLRAHLQGEGKKRVERFSWDATAKEYTALIRSMI